MAQKPKAIIFDFDGTIADSVDVFIDIARKISGDNTKIEAEELRSLRGLIRFGQRINAPYWRFPVALTKVRSMVDKHIHEIEPFEGMPEAIKKLHTSGYQLFIVSTNTRATIEKFLELNDLSDYFSGVYGSRKLVKTKTRSLTSLLRRESLNPANCIFVGDEPRDHQASTAAGVPWVAVTWGFAKRETLEKLNPAALVTEPSELVAAIKLLQ